MINEAEQFLMLLICRQSRSAFRIIPSFPIPFTYALVFERMLSGLVCVYRDTPDLRANTGSTTRNRPRQFLFFTLSA